LFIDTLHPVHEGSLFRWGYSPAETPLLEYGRTSPDALAASGFNPRDVEIAERWRHSTLRGVFDDDEVVLVRGSNDLHQLCACYCRSMGW
jgi:hypothetical protein